MVIAPMSGNNKYTVPLLHQPGIMLKRSRAAVLECISRNFYAYPSLGCPKTLVIKRSYMQETDRLLTLIAVYAVFNSSTSAVTLLAPTKYGQVRMEKVP